MEGLRVAEVAKGHARVLNFLYVMCMYAHTHTHTHTHTHMYGFAWKEFKLQGGMHVSGNTKASASSIFRASVLSLAKMSG